MNLHTRHAQIAVRGTFCDKTIAFAGSLQSCFQQELGPLGSSVNEALSYRSYNTIECIFFIGIAAGARFGFSFVLTLVVHNI